MMRLILTSLVSLLMFGCAKTHFEEHIPYQIPYYVDGTVKPKVVLLPVTDNSESFVPWDICSEFNNTLRYQAMCCSDLFIVPEKEVLGYLEDGNSIDAFDEDLSFTIRFPGNDFVVALDLLEHRLVPFEKGKIYPPIPPQNYNWRSVLQMRMRLRIIDLRYGTPKICLQEIFTSNYAIPFAAESIDYQQCRWGSRAFPASPWGLAHKQLVCDLMFRIETVIQGK